MPVCAGEVSVSCADSAGPNDVLRGLALKKVFRRSRGLFGGSSLTAAVQGASIHLEAQKIYGLVGESGCGKTTLARVLLGAVAPTAGRVEYNLSGRWKNVSRQNAEEQKLFRSRVQMIYQEADLALDPMMLCGASVAEAYTVHFPYLSSSDRMRLSARLFREMLLPLRKYLHYPGTLSGGERKRLAIARAFAALGYGLWQRPNPIPGLIIADELTCGMDGIIQAQILKFLMRVREQLNLGCLLISHDLRLVREFADWVAIMYAGQFIETGSRRSLFARDGVRHPFSKQLLAARGSAVARVATSGASRAGCVFLGECPDKGSRCQEPQILRGPSDHQIACWRETGPVT